ncbi:MAG: energy transducer TonB [Thermomonas sp.]|nr:energy transducer TonB [Thermomonas sp.]
MRQIAPRYPSDAGPRNLAGKVGVAFTIDGEGNVDSPRVTSSDLPRAFERAALQAVARWKFEATGSSHASSSTVHPIRRASRRTSAGAGSSLQGAVQMHPPAGWRHPSH